MFIVLIHYIFNSIALDIICSPFEELSNTIKNSIRSSSFLATCGAIFQSLLCSSRSIFGANFTSSLNSLKNDRKYYYWWIGLFAGMGILIEKKHKRSELALYVKLKLKLKLKLGVILFDNFIVILFCCLRVHDTF